MRKGLCLIMAAVMLLLTMSCAMAEQTVFLPESSFRLTLPDGMEYDGPGTGSDNAKFAYVSAELGLEIHFFLYDRNGAALEAMVEPLKEQGVDEASLYTVNGINMIVYRVNDPDDTPQKGMKCIGYVLADGDSIQQIEFWYATKDAAKLTETIIASITNKD